MDEIINNIFDFLKGNIWFNITTLFIAILGIICAVVFFIKGKKVKETNLYGCNE